MFLVIVDILEEALDFSTSSPPYSNQNKYSSSFESELTKTSWHQAYCQRTQRPKTLTVLRQSGKKKNLKLVKLVNFYQSEAKAPMSSGSNTENCPHLRRLQGLYTWEECFQTLCSAQNSFVSTCELRGTCGYLLKTCTRSRQSMFKDKKRLTGPISHQGAAGRRQHLGKCPSVSFLSLWQVSWPNPALVLFVLSFHITIRH